MLNVFPPSSNRIVPLCRVRWLTSIFLLVALVSFPFVSFAKTLRHGPTGFKVSAPGGYRLSAYQGIYTIKKGRQSVTVMRVSSPLSNKSTAQSLVRSARMKGSKIKGGGSRSVITGLVKGRPVYIEVVGKGPLYKVSKYVTPKKAGRARAITFLTPADVAALRRIANSARGGIVSPFQVNIPVRRFTSGGTFANVPNIPGWTFQGEAQGTIVGLLTGARSGQGFFTFGGYYLSAAGSSDPGQALLNAWPATFGSGMVINPANVIFIPGTYFANSPVAGSQAARFTVRLSFGSESYDAIIHSQTIPNQSGFGFDWYASYVAVRTNSFPGLGQALFNGWTSWNHDASQAARNAQTLATIRSTPGFSIDPDAFDRIHDAWVEYIRR